MRNKDVVFADLLAGSHERVVGTPILSEGMVGEEAARWLYGEAPFGLLAHDTSADPSFVYANVTAQKCFEYSWEEFAGMPSRLSAEADNREKRQEFMTASCGRGTSAATAACASPSRAVASGSRTRRCGTSSTATAPTRARPP
jgi:hypothetical protein